MVSHMKTTVDLPDELLLAAKKRAVETRTTLREILSRGLRRELRGTAPAPPRPRRVRWVTVDGGLPPGVDPTERERMHDALRRRP